jgi:hypothetical protein
VAPGLQQEEAVAASAAATGEPPHDTTVATEPPQEEAAAAAVLSASPALVPTSGDHAVVVDIADDDALPPEWSQWEARPASAPEPVLVMREDGCVMS